MHPDLPPFLRADAARPDEGVLVFDDAAPYRPLIGRWLIDLALMLGWVEQEHRGRLPDLVDNEKFLDLTGLPRLSFADIEGCGGPAELHRYLSRLLREQRAKLAAVEIDPATPLVRNMAMLVEILGLAEAEQAILCFALLLHGIPAFSVAIDRQADPSTLPSFHDMLARLTGLTPGAMRAALRPDAALTAMGLVSLRTDSDRLKRRIEVMEGLTAILLAPQADAETLIACFLKRAPRTSLDLTHFPHLPRDTEAAVGLLRAALAQRTPGTNLLLYGPAGVGKTEYARALAAALGVELYEIGFADEDGDPIRGVARLRAYALCQRLLARHGNALLVFDEVEDVFERNPFAALLGGDESETAGKAWINRILESNPVPALWISNAAQAMDKAYLRRFDYSIRFAIPPRPVRLTMVRHHLGTWADDDAWLERIAGGEHLTPGQLERAAKVARHAGNGDGARNRELILLALDRSAALLGQKRAPMRNALPTGYDLRFVNVDQDIPRLIAALRRRPEGSFCFHGPAGTGKSELARHIADALDKPVLVKRASDLLSKWRGDTEQAIAALFEEAREQEAVLVLDEADSFLRSRSQAHHSWEVTQVNELLTQMEAHDGIFICTTNLMQSLDAASLRRFAWKIRFDWLTPNQRWGLVLQEFARLGGDLAGALPWKEAVRALERLTPGDVAVVVRQYELWDETPAAQAFVEQLRREVELKDVVAQHDLVGNERAAHRHEFGPGTIVDRTSNRRRDRIAT
jgi:SpoVK/Ycf46/Vps4 family AAA+-type ATPase